MAANLVRVNAAGDEDDGLAFLSFGRMTGGQHQSKVGRIDPSFSAILHDLRIEKIHGRRSNKTGDKFIRWFGIDALWLIHLL